MKTSRESELTELFGFLNREDRSLQSLVEGYISYHGITNFGVTRLFFDRLSDSVSRQIGSPSQLQLTDVVDDDSALTRVFLNEFSPQNEKSFFVKSNDMVFETIPFLNSSRNEWRSESIPGPINMRLKEDRRPQISFHVARERMLFVTPFGYQYYDPRSGLYWKIGSSRNFSKSIVQYPVKDIESPVIVVQDEFDGSNFSHFLYDAVPRIIYAIEYLGIGRPIFLMGGIESDYHRIILNWISRKYSIPQTSFVFSKNRENWNIKNKVIFFSDQRAAISHPLHMAHPQTVRLVRDIFDPKILEGEDTLPQKLYISRSDASMRRIKNENQIMEVLARKGFSPIILSKFSAVDQIRMMANAREVIAPHGMGLTNFLFSRRPASVLELFHPTVGSDAYAFVCFALGISYNFIMGHKTSEVDIDYCVDCTELEAF